MTLQTKKELAIPIAIVIGLASNIAYLAHRDGRAAQRQESFEGRMDERFNEVFKRLDKQDSLGDRVNGMATDMALMKRDLAMTQALAERWEREHRLLKDYVEGRIGHLRYRPHG